MCTSFEKTSLTCKRRKHVIMAGRCSFDNCNFRGDREPDVPPLMVRWVVGSIPRCGAIQIFFVFNQFFTNGGTKAVECVILPAGWCIQLFFLNRKESCGPEARCSSVVRAFAHGAMDRRIDPSRWTH